MLNCLNGLVKTGVLWSYVLVICWFLITHGPAALSWHFFFRFFPNSVIFWDFFPQSWCWTCCITWSLAWNTLELFPFFLNVNSILLTLWLQVQISQYFTKEIKIISPIFQISSDNLANQGEEPLQRELFLISCGNHMCSLMKRLGSVQVFWLKPAGIVRVRWNCAARLGWN